MTSKPLFQNNFTLRRPGVAIFLDIIKILPMFIKTIFKDSRKLEIMYQNANVLSISLFLNITKFADFRKKNAFSRTQGVCHVIHIFFGSSFGKV